MNKLFAAYMKRKYQSLTFKQLISDLFFKSEKVADVSLSH